MSERDQVILLALEKAGQPLSAADVTSALGESGSRCEDANRATLNRLSASGQVVKDGTYRKTYRLAGSAPEQIPASEPEQPDRFAVDIPRLGHAGITDPDVLDEIEAEKVWTCAAALRAANTAWGIDMGIDADVREARTLMAEARRQVRERAPLGDHYFEGEAPQAGQDRGRSSQDEMSTGSL